MRWIALLLLLIPGSGILAQGDSLPESVYISGVQGHAQTLSLSCESRSAVDWAAFWGINVGELEFQASLPSSDNPDAGFVGSPNDPWGYIPPRSYGVHAKPVAALLRKYGLQAKAQRDLKWKDLRAEIASGRPVIVWIIGQMWSGTPVSYTASDGHTATVARFEHTMILIGYDTSHVHVVDAYTGWTQTYPLNVFLESWSVLGNIAIFGQGEPPPPASPPQGGKTYTVQHGDYLTALAERFNTTWQALAEQNNIPYPYTIYPGQVLKLSNGKPPPAKRRSPKATSTTIPTATVTPATIPIKPGDHAILLPIILIGTEQVGAIHELPRQELPQPKTANGLPNAYVVQRGDYLLALAERFGMDWRHLADLNNLAYPYVVFPGQVLKLR